MLRKELRELLRTKRLLILLGLFFLFGMMNPAIALLTPKFAERMADDLASQGFAFTGVTVTAAEAWKQFVKNTPMALIVTVIMSGSIYTAEYSRGTLIPLITKGLSRSAAVLAKWAVMLLTWSAGLWLCFGVTYFYSEYYWDNTVVSSLGFTGFCWWLFGVLMLSCIVFFSSFAESGAQVLLGTGGVWFVMLLLGMYRNTEEYLPLHLCDSTPLLQGLQKPEDYSAAILITAGISLLMLLAALPLTKRRRL